MKALLGSRLTEPSKLLLEGPGALRLLHSREAGILLLERSLAEARGLRSERTRLLLLLLLLLGLTSRRSERTAILRLTRTQTIAAEEGVRIRIHGGGNGS